MSEDKDKKERKDKKEKKKEKKKHPCTNYSAALKLIADEDRLGVRMPRVKQWLGELSEKERKVMLKNLAEADPKSIASIFRIITDEETPEDRMNVVVSLGLLINFDEKKEEK